MAIPVPEDVPDEAAVLGDPFAVSLHAVLRNPPPAGGTAVVYGVGALGLTTLAILEALHPDVRVAAVTRFPHQADLAAKHGATTFSYEPREELIHAIADWCGARVRTPWLGLPWTYPGGVDVVYDTVATAETLEVGVRVATPRGRLVITGVSTPERFEWTPWYFKELSLVGSNAFGVEQLNGTRRHAIEHYLELARTGTVDIRHMLTHTFPLAAWRDAFGALARQGESGALKVAFDFRGQ
jgi:threonine dehydrogenase-like Zn-dependent dehydrogenase